MKKEVNVGDRVVVNGKAGRVVDTTARNVWVETEWEHRVVKTTARRVVVVG